MAPVKEVALSFDVGPSPVSIGISVDIDVGIEVGKANPSVKSAGSRSKASVKDVFLVLNKVKYELQLRFTLSLQADERKALKEQVGIWVTHIQVIQLGKKLSGKAFPGKSNKVATKCNTRLAPLLLNKWISPNLSVVASPSNETGFYSFRLSSSSARTALNQGCQRYKANRRNTLMEATKQSHITVRWSLHLLFF